MTTSPCPPRRLPPENLPSRPDEIDLDRVVQDPAYRAAVQKLLRRWGIVRKDRIDT